MKKFLFVQILFVAFLLISFVTSSYGAGNFKEFYNKGIDFYKQGKYDQAGQEFKKAIELKPNDVYALYGLGNTYYCKAKYDDAVKIYTKAININPDYAKVHYSLSLAYSKLGMTREAEKQKTMFRKLSQGGKSTGSSTHTKVSHTSSHAKAEHAPKKTLSHTPKKSLHETKQADTHKAHDTHAASTHETKHADTRKAHDTHAASTHETKHADTHKADERVFKKEPHGTYSFSTKPFRSVKYFIQDKWYSSGINKIWICAAGYIFGTQIWLCVVAFFCVIVWRIREKV
jgi:tetratricopeptide (TPR) repeat protein